MSKAYILIGVPASGKSTWVSQQSFDRKKTVIASTDDHIETYARDKKMSYNEAFHEYIDEATNKMIDSVIDAIDQKFDIIWDQTSITKKSRSKKLKMIPKDYEKIAVVFSIPKEDELKKRLTSRPGKVIPNRVMSQMIDHFEEPTKEEGFDRIIYINESEK